MFISLALCIVVCNAFLLSLCASRIHNNNNQAFRFVRFTIKDLNPSQDRRLAVIAQVLLLRSEDDYKYQF